MGSKSDKQVVLIVDDVPENIDVLANALKSDYKVKVAPNGEKAIKIARAGEPPDLIVLDVLMPQMNGYEVCRVLQAEEKTKDIPVIFVTALTEEQDETKGLELGAVDYITKPFSIPIVKARIKTHLLLKLAREELKQQNATLREAVTLREDIERMSRHDLKAPLNAIINLPGVILENKHLTDDEREALGLIEEAGYDMLKMINLSLDLYKMETGAYNLKSGPINVVSILSKIMEGVNNLIKIRKLSVRIFLQGRPVEDSSVFIIQGEEMLCYTMLANLIHNALEASPEDEVITISLDTDESLRHVIQIHNKGAVPEDIRERFFHKYVTSGKNSGTGLGTYSARLIAQTQGGDIELDVSKPKETLVTITLPGKTD
ncbi:MAG: hybrid sensor histidine kinase/response regulator [Deltaproteobacteria bacterium]|nr:hybrid sensor histidine kinase/response regulator [Deltaproteobacteria bacterium]